MHGHRFGGDLGRQSETWREHGGWLMRDNQLLRCLGTGVAVTWAARVRHGEPRRRWTDPWGGSELA